MKSPSRQRKTTMGTKLYLRSILSIILLNLVLFPIRAALYMILGLACLLVVLMRPLTLLLIKSLIPAHLTISQQAFLDEELEFDPDKIDSSPESGNQWTSLATTSKSTSFPSQRKNRRKSCSSSWSY